MMLQQIRCFIAVAEAGSFTAAAKVLHLSQPALGGHVRNLEASLGVALLERHSRGVVLSPAGQAFLDAGRRVMAALEEARATVEPFHARVVRVALGITPTSGKTLVPDLLMDGAAQQPEMQFHLRAGLSDELRQLLIATSELDAAFCYDPEPHDALTIYPLYEEDLFLVGVPRLVNTADGPLPQAELHSFPLVLDHRFHAMRRMIEDAARERGVALQVRVEAEPTEVKRALVMQRSNCTVVPYGLFMEEIARGALCARRIVDPPLSRTLALVTRRRLPALVGPRLVALVRSIAERKVVEGGFGWRPVPS
jgi:LysR family nitrogen assimilation transcriptional regulator